MTDNFVFEMMERFNGSNVVELSLTRGDTSLQLKKKEAFGSMAETVGTAGTRTTINSCNEGTFRSGTDRASACESMEKTGARTEGNAAETECSDNGSRSTQENTRTSGVSRDSGASGKTLETAGNTSSKSVEEKTPDCNLETITCPIVGTFYRSPSPDSPAYAEKGKKIKKGEPLCIIEAMKMMNTLTADFDLEIVDVLMENAVLAEYGQPLFTAVKL